MIRVLFFAQLREQLQCDGLTIEFTMPISVSELREELIQKNPHWNDFLSNEKLLFAVNQTLVKSNQLIADGDEVAFFPPVTGG
jgi:molybdopterin synthase sulfur carrier subunit